MIAIQPKNKMSSQTKYQKINGCSHKPSTPQVIAFLIFAIAIALHSVLITTILEISSSIVYFLFALHYIILTAVVTDYIILTLSDPVDPRLLEEQSQKKQQNPNELVYCQNCKKKVHMYSYHCRKCKRCAQEFDHHCVFLNNCIGKKNYSSFFRFLLTVTIFLLLNIGQGVWAFLVNESEYRWVALTLAIYCFLIVPQIVFLAIFHCYISFFLYKTTLEVIRGDMKTDQIAYIRQSTPQRRLDSKKDSRSTQSENNVTTEADLNPNNSGKMESL